MELSNNQKVGELVAENFQAADVFLNYGIDFCCGGNVTIQEVCRKQGVDEDKLMRDLKQVLTHRDVESDLVNRLSLGALIEHIVYTHHKFVRENIQSIPPYLNKLEEVHGVNHPELIYVNSIFSEVAREMAGHLVKEEEILFPYITLLEKGLTTDLKGYASLKDAMDDLHSEHDSAGEGMRRIGELTGGYVTPSDGCNTYQVALEKLKAFEKDLHRHVHLENNILFPKALSLEKK